MNTIVARAILVILALLLVCPAAPGEETAEPAPDKKDRIRHFLVLTDAKSNGYQSGLMMVDAMRKVNTELPDEAWDEILDLIVAHLDELIELMVPIYDRHFTAEEIEGLIAFYESPVGRKFIEEQPAVTQEAVMAGEQWGQRVVGEILPRLQELMNETAEEAPATEGGTTSTGSNGEAPEHEGPGSE